MSNYTTQVRWIVENCTPDLAGQPLTARITASVPKIFDFDFPIFEESHRLELCRKILLHYITKEIGLETVGLWKLFLNERLNLIMPYYNNLYEIESRKFDYLTTDDRTETYKNNRKLQREGTNNLTRKDTDNTTKQNTQDDTASTIQDGANNSTETRSGNESNKNLVSDLPQANYAGVDYGTNLTDGTRTASENNKNEQTTKSTTSATGKTTMSGTDNRVLDSNEQGKSSGNESEDSSYERTTTGYAGENPTKLMLDYRNSIINIDKMIVEELVDLFILIN